MSLRLITSGIAISWKKLKEFKQCFKAANVLQHHLLLCTDQIFSKIHRILSIFDNELRLQAQEILLRELNLELLVVNYHSLIQDFKSILIVVY